MYVCRTIIINTYQIMLQIICFITQVEKHQRSTTTKIRLQVWGFKSCIIKNVSRLYINLIGLDHLEAIRGRLLRELEAVFESFCLYKVWGTKSCGLKNV